MPLKKISLVLNTDDPEQSELYDFIRILPNGKKRNSSAFLRTLTDREYQVKRESYLAEVKKYKSPRARVIKSEGGGIRYLMND